MMFVSKLFVLWNVILPSSCFMIHDMRSLKKALLEEYDDIEFLPRENQTAKTVVKVKFIMTMLQELNEKEQKFTMLGFFNISWKDEFLSWNGSEYNGIRSITLPRDKVWRPSIALVNPAEDLPFLKGSPEDTVLRVNHEGVIVWFPGERLSVRCEMDVSNYPFDEQHCKAVLSMWGKPHTLLEFEAMANKVVFLDITEHPIWTIKGTDVRKSVSRFRESIYIMDFYFARKPLFTIGTVILPIIMLSFINDLVFLLPNSSGERNSFAMTSFLAYAVFISSVSSSLPEDSTRISYITLYLSGLLAKSVVIVFIVVLQSRRVENPANEDKKEYKIEDKESERGKPTERHFCNYDLNIFFMFFTATFLFTTLFFVMTLVLGESRNVELT